MRELTTIGSDPSRALFCGLCLKRPVGDGDARHIETISRERIPAATVHAPDEVELRRIDVASVRIQHELVGNVDRHHMAENHRAIDADLDDDQPLALERHRTCYDARRLYAR